MKRVNPERLEAILSALDDRRMWTASTGMHGYELAKITGIKTARLSVILARLEADGCVAAEAELPAEWRNSGRPARVYYRLTASGKGALADIRNGAIPTLPALNYWPATS